MHTPCCRAASEAYLANVVGANLGEKCTWEMLSMGPSFTVICPQSGAFLFLLSVLLALQYAVLTFNTPFVPLAKSLSFLGLSLQASDLLPVCVPLLQVCIFCASLRWCFSSSSPLSLSGFLSCPALHVRLPHTVTQENPDPGFPWLGVVAHACNPRTQEAKAKVQTHPGPGV